MRTPVSVAIGLVAAAAVFPAAAATKAPSKAAPACSAITFRPLPAGTADGEQPAGIINRATLGSSCAPRSNKGARSITS